jgi:hypothetical protein
MELTNADGQGTEATEIVPLELVPPDLRFPNTEVWLMVKSTGDWRTGEELKTTYEVLPRRSE